MIARSRAAVLSSGVHRAFTLILASAFALAACGGNQSPPPSPPPQEQPTSPAQPPASGGELTAEQCAAAGGEVVGDIGDGAIHRPDYRCPKSGEPPLGHITTPPGEPRPIEGAVCCR